MSCKCDILYELQVQDKFQETLTAIYMLLNSAKETYVIITIFHHIHGSMIVMNLNQV